MFAPWLGRAGGPPHSSLICLRDDGTAIYDLSGDDAFAGAVEFIHRKLVDARDSGMAVLLVSAELEEVLSLADRLAVMYRGRIAAIVDPQEATPELLGYLMATGVMPSAEQSPSVA